MAPAAVAVVLILVTSLSVWASLGTSRGADVVERSALLDRQYQRARAAVAAEAQAEAAYRWKQSPSVRADYNAAAAELGAALERLQQIGGEEDRATARRIADMHQEYLRADARLFAALDRGDAQGAAAVDTKRIETLFREVRVAVDEAAEMHRADAAASIDELKETSQLVTRLVPIAGAAGMLLVIFFSLVMVSYRRQVREATEREIARLQRAALADNLTGLGNHRALHEVLPLLSAKQSALGSGMAIIALDLDGLKEINDTRGHHDGDQLIQRLSAGLMATLPAGSHAFRIGGDEFVAVIEGWTAAEAFHYTQQLQTHLAPPEVGILAASVGTEPTHVTVGVADLTGCEGDAECALRRADIALIEAKRLSHRGLIWSAGIEAAAAAAAVRGAYDHRKLLATALAKAVDAKDSYTRSHCETVSQLCVLIAEQLGLPAEDVEQLRLAGLLHDVGKIGVPDAILQKPDKLTDEEYAEMQYHSTLGANIVAAAQLTEESSWVRHHHERLDGRGYPHGLSGTEIPLQSRIIFVADAFEAITSDRPYRLGRPADEALAELRRCAGTQFDPECVTALELALDAAGPGAVVPASQVSPPRRVLGVVPDPVAAREDAARRAA